MFFGVQLIPKALTKIGRIVTNALQIVEVFRGDLLEYFTHACHGYLREIIPNARRVDPVDKILHQLPPLGNPYTGVGLLEIATYMSHGDIVYYAAVCYK